MPKKPKTPQINAKLAGRINPSKNRAVNSLDYFIGRVAAHGLKNDRNSRIAFAKGKTTLVKMLKKMHQESEGHGFSPKQKQLLLGLIGDAKKAKTSGQIIRLIDNTCYLRLDVLE